MIDSASLFYEPVNNPSSASATSITSSSITVSWADSVAGTTAPEQYLILCSTGTPATPVDGVPQTTNACSDNTGADNVTYTTTSATFSSLTAETEYFFAIYPYTNSGSNINFKTDGTIASTSATTGAVPVITLPTAPSVNENSTDVALADTIAITDADDDAQMVTVTVTGGTVSIGNTVNVFFNEGDGTDDSSMIFSGTLAHINTALDGMTFTPTANTHGSNAGSIQIQTDDGKSGTDDQTLTFDITDVNPVISDATVSLAENSANDTPVTTVTATDDTNGLTYSITAGTFKISDASTGAISVNDVNELDVEITTSYTLTVSVDDEDADNTADDTATITVNITNVDEGSSVSITGTATQGEALTAIVTDADGVPSAITYQWKANDTDISGATSQTFVLTQDEVGKKITVTATYTDDGTTAEKPTSAETVAVANVNDAGAVSITGTVSQGETLTATVTDADGATGTITYQWKADGADISGATSLTFVLTQDEVGKTITVTATYTDDLGTAETPISAATSAVTNVNDAGTVSITGTPTEDQTLTATITDTDGATGTITYQWKADGTDISGATSQTFVLTQDEVGKTITVQATYTDDGGTDETPTSTATSAVANVNDAPVITSTAGTTATENSAYTYAPMATDADNDTLIWSISNASAGMSIDATTGVISWTPTGGVTTSSAVTITVTDNGTGTLTDTQTFTIAVTLTTDTDGVDPAEEQAAPNNGDGNEDGIPDSIQANVASVSGQEAGTYYTVDATQSPACTQVGNVSVTPESALGSGTDPGSFDYEAGLVNFTLNCSTANVVVYFHGLSEAPHQVRKYGFTPASTPPPIPASPGTRVWYNMPGAVIETVTIDGKTVYKASYTLTDGGLGDDDLTVNGTIVDPVGAAQQIAGAGAGGAGGAGSARSIPGLSEWAQYVLMLLLAIAGTRLHWQRQRQSGS